MSNNRQSYPTTAQYNEAIMLMASSIEDESADAMFYDWLINNIPNNISLGQRRNIKETIEGIKADEQSHNKIFKGMYKQLTGKEATPEKGTFTPPKSFEEGIVKAIKGETEAVRRYRTIMAGLPDNSFRDPVFNVLTDELRHGILYNYIYSTVPED